MYLIMSLFCQLLELHSNSLWLFFCCALLSVNWWVNMYQFLSFVGVSVCVSQYITPVLLYTKVEHHFDSADCSGYQIWLSVLAFPHVYMYGVSVCDVCVYIVCVMFLEHWFPLFCVAAGHELTVAGHCVWKLLWIYTVKIIKWH